MPNCLLVAAGLPLMRREELDAATVVLVVVVVLVVGSTCSASGSFDLVLLLDEVPPMPIAGDMPMMPSLSERERTGARCSLGVCSLGLCLRFDCYEDR